MTQGLSGHSFMGRQFSESSLIHQIKPKILMI